MSANVKDLKPRQKVYLLNSNMKYVEAYVESIDETFVRINAIHSSDWWLLKHNNLVNVYPIIKNGKPQFKKSKLTSFVFSSATVSLLFVGIMCYLLGTTVH